MKYLREHSHCVSPQSAQVTAMPESARRSIKSLRASASSIIALALPPPPSFALSEEDDPAEVHAFDKLSGSAACKAKHHFIRASLEKSLRTSAQPSSQRVLSPDSSLILSDDTVQNDGAKLFFTEHWKYNNCSRAIVVGWPDEITWECISLLSGHETAYNILLKLLRLGSLYIRIASAAEWAGHQADGARQGATIFDTPSDKAPRRDRGVRRSRIHIRKRLRPVRDYPKSAEFIDDSEEELA